MKLKIILIIFFISVPFILLANSNKQLIEAAQAGDINKAKLALKNGADVNLKNKSGQTALDLAKKLEYSKLIPLLKKGK